MMMEMNAFVHDSMKNDFVTVAFTKFSIRLTSFFVVVNFLQNYEKF